MRARPILALAAGLWLAAFAGDRVRDWVDTTVLPPLTPATSAEVLARDGTLLRAFTVGDGRWRLAVDPTRVDPRYLKMLIGYEDRRFYRHAGVDPLAMLRAAGQTLMSGHIVSGGSTLTMQVARLLEDSGTGRIAGKLRQIRVALSLERRLTKAQILALYLQIAPFGGNLEGVRSASLAYFGKEPRRLTPAQSALLVALPQSPETRRPDRFPDAARTARNRVLMRAEGAGLLTLEQAISAETEPVPTARLPVPALAPHVAERLHAESPSLSPLRTTIDAGLQRRLEDLAAESVAHRGQRLQVAIVVAEQASGRIIASVGSAAYTADRRQGFIDMTRALRSPGSTLKPLIYGLAFDEGLGHPETLIDDRPVDFDGYAPQNFDHQFRGTIRLREALQLSLNIPAVLLTDALGPAKLMSAMRRAGTQPVVPGGQPGLAIALGGVGISLQDLVQIYAAIARGGVALPLHLRADAAPAPGARILSAVAAWEVGDILSGLAPPPGAPRNRLAYKTGTSYGHRDAWAIGFDGRHVVGIWMGRADGTPVPGAFGGELAAPVLFQAFNRVTPRLAPLPPPPANTLMVANAQLPPPLRHFRSRRAAFGPAEDAPQLAFPPDGALVERTGGDLLVRVRGGIAPFTWLANGRPVVIGTRDAQALLPLHAGFVSLSVIDAAGRAARAEVRLR
ncbi:penicillin-binding protein 1C [Acidimangrovimonas sediminis]|uniref:penicillin-binding protein 1C n=1 Tax=Acidimangrovimonas sediminis TaxID=2056283 RepID=UPI000C810783|nr:penicillin-binding protein 1C [Acidimangrovimonas sediminis]